VRLHPSQNSFLSTGKSVDKQETGLSTVNYTPESRILMPQNPLPSFCG